MVCKLKEKRVKRGACCSVDGRGRRAEVGSLSISGSGIEGGSNLLAEAVLLEFRIAQGEDGRRLHDGIPI